jgi:hypothetical protein
MCETWSDTWIDYTQFSEKEWLLIDCCITVLGGSVQHWALSSIYILVQMSTYEGTKIITQPNYFFLLKKEILFFFFLFLFLTRNAGRGNNSQLLEKSEFPKDVFYNIRLNWSTYDSYVKDF